MPAKYKTISYSGTESYRYVEPLIYKGKDVLISSPYIDRHYADFIVRNSRGKRIHILASSMDSEARRHIHSRPVLPVVAALMALASAGFLLYALRVYLLLGIDTAAMILFVYATVIFWKRTPNIKIRTPTSFVHAKMYVTESAAAYGSANLTYRGMHRNVEHLEVTEDPEKIENLKKQFWSIWGMA